MGNAQTVQDLFNMSREEWLDGARVRARHLLRNRSTITSEDITRDYPLPKYLHHNTIGHILKENDTFHAVGYTRAKRPSSNGRVIRVWTLSDKYAKDFALDCE